MTYLCRFDVIISHAFNGDVQHMTADDARRSETINDSNVYPADQMKTKLVHTNARNQV